MQNKQLQTVTRVQCEGLRLVAVSRFLYNCQVFCGEVQGMLTLLSPEGPPEPPRQPPVGYRPITEVSRTSLRVVLAAWSGSDMLLQFRGRSKGFGEHDLRVLVRPQPTALRVQALQARYHDASLLPCPGCCAWTCGIEEGVA